MFVLTSTPKEFIPSTEKGKEKPLTFVIQPPTKKQVLEIQEALFQSLDLKADEQEVSLSSIPLATLMDAYINACVVGWKNVVDEEGNEVPFSRDNLEFFNDTTILMELYNFCKEMSEGSEKN
jgi:hypothetical protein